MSTFRRRFSVPVAIAFSLAGLLSLSACSVADSFSEAILKETANQFDEVVDDTLSEMNDAISDTIGGAGISADGELPDGFPSDEVPIVGDVQGGGAAPDDSGWVVRTTVTGTHPFGKASKALEKVSDSVSTAASGSDTGVGRYSNDAFSVLLSVVESGDGATATYVVKTQ